MRVSRNLCRLFQIYAIRQPDSFIPTTGVKTNYPVSQSRPISPIGTKALVALITGLNPGTLVVAMLPGFSFVPYGWEM